jgi:AP-3 complex subunit beta
MLGSSTLVIGETGVGGHGLLGYRELPDWVKEGEEPDARLRDEVGEKAEYGAEKPKSVPASRRLDEAVREQGLVGRVAGVSKQKPKEGLEEKGKSLDDWLDESEEEESGESEEDSEEGSTEEESGSEDETESGEGSEADEGKRLVD